MTENAPQIKIYVASGFPFKEQVIQTNQYLKEHGYSVVSTWAEREVRLYNPNEDGLDAQQDIDELISADVVLALMNDDKYAYRGTWTEIGAGLALSKKVIIVCDGYSAKLKAMRDAKVFYPYQCMTNVFFWHPHIHHFQNVDEALN